MIEALGGLELLHAVAGGAIGGAELAAMHISMAGGAPRLETQEGAREVDVFGEERCRVADRLLAVAAPAGERRVGALQRIARRRMVERLLAALAPIDEIEGAPLVLDVAALAFAVVGTGMQAFVGVDALGERAVAGEAAPAIDAALGAVAFEAAVAAVELGVGAAQLAGRDLGARRSHGGKGRAEPRERCREDEARACRPAGSQCPNLA